jgi:hypothetical protein
VVVPAGRRTITLASPAASGSGPAGRRADATLVGASITARLLGLRLLTLDAKVALVPAEVAVTARRVRKPARVPVPAPPSADARGRTDAIGPRRGLADAVRDLNEGARVLAEVHRRNGS